jgi:replicative DNA helicase
MSAKAPDLNDRLRAGTLPEDPFAGETVSEDFPRISTVRDLLMESMKHCFDQSPRSFSTFGHPAIDEATGGAVPGEVTFLGADSSWGKSSYALMVADENAKLGRRVLVVSAEDSRLTFGNRLMRRRAKVSALDMRHRRLSKEELERVSDVAAKGEAVPAFIDARSHTIEWLVPRLKAAITEHKIDLLVCDYVGAFNKSKVLNDQGQRGTVQYLARTLVDICKTCTPTGIAGLILTQITQDEKQPIPGKYALRDSKDQVHMAENVLIGFIAPHDIKGARGDVIAREGERCLKVAKAKEGEVGKSLIVLPWNSYSACFDAAREEPRRDWHSREPQPVSDDAWGNWDNEGAAS